MALRVYKSRDAVILNEYNKSLTSNLFCSDMISKRSHFFTFCPYSMGMFVSKNTRLYFSYIKQTSGNVAIMFALCLSLIMLTIGAAIDAAVLYKTKEKMTYAADAAMLSGATAIQDAYREGKNNPRRAGQRAARESFRIHTADEYEKAKFKPNFQIDGTSVIGESNFSYSVSTYFGGLFGKKVRPVKGNNEIRFRLVNNVDITFLIDNSPSLAMGSTIDDQQAMFARTGCTFACHLPRGNWELPHNPEAHRLAGTELRIDTARKAAISAVELLQSSIENEDQARISVYTFSNTVDELVGPTTDFDDVISALRTLDLVDEDNTNNAHYGGTIIQHSIRRLRDILNVRASFDQRNNDSNRSSYVILFTDGIENGERFAVDGELAPGVTKYSKYSDIKNWVEEPDRYNRIQVFDRNSCDVLKSLNHEVFAVQTLYETTPEMRNPDWAKGQVDYISAMTSETESRFKSCASRPANYYLTRNKADIEEGFKKIIEQIVTENNLYMSR